MYVCIFISYQDTLGSSATSIQSIDSLNSVTSSPISRGYEEEDDDLDDESDVDYYGEYVYLYVSKMLWAICKIIIYIYRIVEIVREGEDVTIRWVSEWLEKPENFSPSLYTDWLTYLMMV